MSQRLAAQLAKADAALKACEADRDRLVRENEELRKALEHYAFVPPNLITGGKGNINDWHWHIEGPEIAQAALERIKHDKTM